MGMISKKAAALQSILESNGMLQKTAEKLEHIASPENLKLEQRQQKEIEKGTQGNYASAANATPIPAEADELDTIEGSSKTPAKSDMKSTGTTINNITTDGCPQGTPAQVVSKTAALKQRLAACLGAEMQKNDMAKKAAAEAEAANNFVTAGEVIHKVAALASMPDGQEADYLAADIEHDFTKLAKYNPLFEPACEQVAFRKMAAEIEALAEAEGIPEEAAAEALDAAMAEDPAAQEEFNNEVEGEAVSDMADAEAATEQLMAGLDDTAAQVSELTGQPITSEDIINAVEQVVDQAEEMGVEPEALIQAAVEEMTAGSEDNVTEEDMAAAEQLVEEAAANGVSPEELLQALVEEQGAGEAVPEEAAEAPAEAPAEEAAATEEAPAEELEKSASFHTLNKLASTRRGANLARILDKLSK